MRCVLVLVLVACSSSSPNNGAATGGTGGLGTGGSGGKSGDETEPPAPDGGGGAAGQKRAFVTSSRYFGDLETSGGAATGLAGADKLCQTAADAATLGGSWRAWVSIGVPMSNGATIHAVDHLMEVGPWFRIDGEKAFNNKANLMTAPLVPLDRDENGRAVETDGEVWTGTSQGGRWSGQDCAQWTNGTIGKTATIGDARAHDGTWTDNPMQDCDVARRLYCFEQ